MSKEAMMRNKKVLRQRNAPVKVLSMAALAEVKGGGFHDLLLPPPPPTPHDHSWE